MEVPDGLPGSRAATIRPPADRQLGPGPGSSVHRNEPRLVDDGRPGLFLELKRCCLLGYGLRFRRIGNLDDQILHRLGRAAVARDRMQRAGWLVEGFARAELL